MLSLVSHEKAYGEEAEIEGRAATRSGPTENDRTRAGVSVVPLRGLPKGTGERMTESGYVYFIETKCGRFVKIGYSIDPHRRIGELGTLRPSAFDAHILGFIPGTKATEQWLHSQFQQERDNGEWFTLSP